MRIFLVILAALIVAGGTGFYVLQGLRPARPRGGAGCGSAAEAGLRSGARDPDRHDHHARARSPGWKSRRARSPAQMIVADAAGEAFLAGSVARQVLPQGVPIARSAIVQPGDRGFLAAVLPKGKRAITIPISEIAGLERPGAARRPGRPDPDLFRRRRRATPSARSAPARRSSSNIRVLAFDQRLGPEAPPKDKEGKAEAPPVAQTATLEVTPQQAEMITLGQTLGTLSLVLNSVRDGGDERRAGGKTEAVEPRRRPRPRCLKAGRGARSAAPRRQTLESDVTSTTRCRSCAACRSASTADRPARPPAAAAADRHRIGPHTRE